MNNLTEEQLDNLYDWACNEENGGITHYAGMTYEDGIKAMVDPLKNNGDIEDLK